MRVPLAKAIINTKIVSAFKHFLPFGTETYGTQEYIKHFAILLDFMDGHERIYYEGLDDFKAQLDAKLKFLLDWKMGCSDPSEFIPSTLFNAITMSIESMKSIAE